MNLEDRELDALLRDVPVPPGLHDKLKRIPGEFEPVVVRGSTYSTWRLVTGLAFAAGLIGVTCWLVWPDLNSGTPEIAKPNEPDVAPALVVSELEPLSEQIDDLTWQLEFEKQTRSLSELRSAIPMTSTSYQTAAERDALTMYLSGEAAVSWGAGNDFVRAEMQQIIQRYPNTAGAIRAQEFLKQQSTEL